MSVELSQWLIAGLAGAAFVALFVICFVLGYLWARPVGFKRVNIEVEHGEFAIVDCPDNVIVTITDYDIDEDGGVVQTFVGEEEANVQGRGDKGSS